MRVVLPGSSEEADQKGGCSRRETHRNRDQIGGLPGTLGVVEGGDK